MDPINQTASPFAEVSINFPNHLTSNLNKQVIMVTGAGCKIGCQLSNKIAQERPRTILLFESDEHALSKVFDEVNAVTCKLLRHPENPNKHLSLLPKVVPLLGSITDEPRISDVVSTWKPDVIFHAAELALETIAAQNVTEYMKTNVLGCLTIAKVAIEQQVTQLIKITQGSGAAPTSTLSASQRFSDLILESLATERRPKLEPIWVSMPAEEVPCNTQFSLARVSQKLTSNKATCALSNFSRQQPFIKPWPELQTELQTLKIAISCADSESIQMILTTLMPAYQPSQNSAPSAINRSIINAYPKPYARPKETS